MPIYKKPGLMKVYFLKTSKFIQILKDISNKLNKYESICAAMFYVPIRLKVKTNIQLKAFSCSNGIHPF